MHMRMYSPTAGEPDKISLSRAVITGAAYRQGRTLNGVVGASTSGQTMSRPAGVSELSRASSYTLRLLIRLF